METPTWFTRHISRDTLLPNGPVAAAIDALANATLGVDDGLALELFLLCCSDRELSVCSLDGWPEGFLLAGYYSERSGNRVVEALLGTFRGSAPRELFPAFGGKAEDPAREAIILANLVDGRLGQYWWNERRDTLGGSGYSSADWSVPAFVQCAKRILANRRLHDEVRNYVVPILATSSSPQLAASCGTALKEVPMVADTALAVRARLGRCGRQGSMRILSWALPEIGDNGEARRLAKEFLKSEFEDVRYRAARSLLKDLRREDMVPDLLAMAYGEEGELADAILAAVPADIVRQQAAIHLLPKLKDGTIRPEQGRALAGQIGTDHDIAKAFMDLAIEVDRGTDELAERRLGSLLGYLANSSAKLPTALWDLVTSSVVRQEYLPAENLCGLALAHAENPRAHALLLHLLESGHWKHIASETAAAISVKSAAFEKTVLELLARLPEYDRSILVSALARHRPDEKAQKVVARELSRFIRRPHDLRLATDIMNALAVVDWKMPIIDAVEAAAAMTGEISRHAIRLLGTRVPGTATAKPQKFADEMRLISEIRVRQEASPPPALAFPPNEIRRHSRFSFGFLGHDTWPPPLARADYPEPERALAMLGPYKVDPHPDFWLHMPEDLVTIKVCPVGCPSRGREILEFGFANRSVLRMEANDLLNDAGKDKGPSLLRGRNNPHTSKLGVDEMLAVIRANIGLLAKPGQDTIAETVVQRPRGMGSLPRPPRQGRGQRRTPGSGTPPSRLLAYHPLRFIQAYRESAFADAYDQNLISVFKKSPAQRVVPGLGLKPEEAKWIEGRLVALEACSLFWLRGGAHIIDLSDSEVRIPRAEPAHHMALQPFSDGAIRYVFLGKNGPSADGRTIDGFYFGWSDAGSSPGYTVFFTIRHVPGPGFDDTAALARSLSLMVSAFLPSGKPWASVRGETPPFLVAAASAAFIAINLAASGTTRTIHGIDSDPAYIPVPYGRKAGNDRWLVDNVPISTCYPFRSEGKRKPDSAEHEHPSMPRPSPVDEMPEGCDGSATFYVVETSPGTWKRLKKGDYSGANGKAVFPQLAGSRLKMIEAAAYLQGRKAIAVASVRPHYLSFGSDADLAVAWRQWVHETMFQLHSPDMARQPWTVTRPEIDAVRAVLLRGGRSAVLEPDYG